MRSLHALRLVEMTILLNHNLKLRLSLFTFGNAIELAFLSLNHNLFVVDDVNTLLQALDGFAAVESLSY